MVTGRLPGDHGYPCQPGQKPDDATFNQSHTGGAVMKKFVIGGIILVLVTCGWGTMSVGEQTPAPRGELRIVDSSSFNFVTVVNNVFDHLVDLEEWEKPVPRLATGW